MEYGFESGLWLGFCFGKGGLETVGTEGAKLDYPLPADSSDKLFCRNPISRTS